MVCAVHDEFDASGDGDELADYELVTHKIVVVGNVFLKGLRPLIHVIVIRIIANDDVWPRNHAFDIAKRFELGVWVNRFDLFFHINMIANKRKKDWLLMTKPSFRIT